MSTTTATPPAPTHFLAPALQKLTLRLPFDPTVRAPLPPSKAAAGGTARPRADLSERVQRLLEKFEALSTMHQTYREDLLERVRGSGGDAEEVEEASVRAPLLLERRSLAASMHAC